MKKIIAISFCLGLMFGATGVASADVGAKKVPKTDTYDVLAFDAPSFEIAITDLALDVDVIGFEFVAVVPSPVFVPVGSVSFVKEKKPVYRSPDVDRKWVWWNSIITNS
jgi:hypothetical protein